MIDDPEIKLLLGYIETKGRVVRTEAGSAKFKKPIGQIISGQPDTVQQAVGDYRARASQDSIKPVSKPKFAPGDRVEVHEPDFETPGFPHIWHPGTVDRVEARDDGKHDVFVRTDRGSWSPQIVGPKGGNRRIRAAQQHWSDTQGAVTRDTTASVDELMNHTMANSLDSSSPKIQALAEDMKKNGVTKPVQVEMTNKGPLVTDGHHRLLAAREAGISHIPVRVFANSPEGRSAANRAMVEVAPEPPAVESEDYRMTHRPADPEGGMPLHDLTVNMPEDVYSHPEFYGDTSDSSFMEAHNQIVKTRNKPDAMVHIYRSLPAEHAGEGIHSGDWVSLSKDYAKQLGFHATDENQDMPVIHAVVPAHTLFTHGDDLREFGYHGPAITDHDVAFPGGKHNRVKSDFVEPEVKELLDFVAEIKARVVRTEAGSRKFKKPIGSVIGGAVEAAHQAAPAKVAETQKDRDNLAYEVTQIEDLFKTAQTRSGKNALQTDYTDDDEKLDKASDAAHKELNEKYHINYWGQQNADLPTLVAKGTSWMQFGPCRQIRDSAYDLLGFEPDKVADPHVNTNLDPGYGGADLSIPEDAARVQAALLLEGIEEAPPVQMPLYRGIKTDQAEQIIQTLKPGDSFSLPIASFSHETYTADMFGTDITFQVLPGAKAIPATGSQYADDPAYENEFYWNEYVSGGQFEVVNVKAEMVAPHRIGINLRDRPSEPQPGYVVTLKQLGVFDPGSGNLVKTSKEDDTMSRTRWQWSYLFDGNVVHRPPPSTKSEPSMTEIKDLLAMVSAIQETKSRHVASQLGAAKFKKPIGSALGDATPTVPAPARASQGKTRPGQQALNEIAAQVAKGEKPRELTRDEQDDIDDMKQEELEDSIHRNTEKFASLMHEGFADKMRRHVRNLRKEDEVETETKLRHVASQQGVEKFKLPIGSPLGAGHGRAVPNAPVGKAKVRIRQGTYQNQAGHHLSGTDAKGRRVSVFVPGERPEAEKARDNIHAGRGAFEKPESAVARGRNGMGDIPIHPDMAADLMGTPEAPSSASPHLTTDGKGQVMFTPERQKLHDELISQFLQGNKPTPAPEYHILGGGPAAGKSTLIKSGKIPGLGENSVLVNADEFKLMLPEYEEGLKNKDPMTAQRVHEESSYLAKRTQAAAMEHNYNITLDGTGDSSSKSLLSKINAAKKHGYKVHGYYTTVPTDEAVKRANARGEKTGRFVPESILRGTHKSVSQVLPETIKAFDEVHLFDTTTGVHPVMSFQSGQMAPTIHNPVLWDTFLKKAHE